MLLPDPHFYKPLSALVEWADNYSHGDVAKIARSIRRFGFNAALRVWRDDVVIAGNHTMKALRLIRQEGPNAALDFIYPPQNVVLSDEDWHVPYVDVSHLNVEEAKAFAIADNALARQAVVDEVLLAQYLQEIAERDQDTLLATGYDPESLNALLAELSAAMVDQSAIDTKPDAARRERLRNVDIIYTSGTQGKGGSGAEPTPWVQVHCCVAVKSGWLYGVRSSDGVCHTAEQQEAHRPQFIDNHYHHYDHQQHLTAIKRWRPKYATVRDIMSKAQCKAAGIDYYPFEQILDWAHELAEYAQNVILIPKIDVIDRIPPQFMLGYSVPTSYGGTPLPIERFAGRRVHLLGGSPRRQIRYFQVLPDDIVSLDNNYILKAAHYGRFWMPDGTMKSLEHIGLTDVTNPLYLALALNFGNFAAYFNKTGSANLQFPTGTIEPAEEEGSDYDYPVPTP